MSWSAKQHPIEMAAEWLAPAIFAVSAGWAGLQFKLPLHLAGALGLLLFSGAFLALRVLGASKKPPRYGFEPADIETVELEELLLREEDEVLILDDPLIEPSADSRVVQLFARQEPTPGELVEKITEFLGEGRRPVQVTEEVGPASLALDASAALHSALANIRASLR
jgi:hypothetical protein